MVGKPKMNPLSKFQVYSAALLTIVKVLYIGSPELMHFA